MVSAIWIDAIDTERLGGFTGSFEISTDTKLSPAGNEVTQESAESVGPRIEFLYERFPLRTKDSLAVTR